MLYLNELNRGGVMAKKEGINTLQRLMNVVFIVWALWFLFFVFMALSSGQVQIDLSTIVLGSRLYTDQYHLDNAKKLRSAHTGNGIKLKV